jgi:4-amino-4-deoxy-L-arabinose transferase-like glycosyltransferase
VLGAIVFLGLLLRAWRFHQVGLLDYDDGYFLCVTRTWWDVLGWIWAKITGTATNPSSLSGLKTFLLTRGDAVYHAAKPGHVMLIFLTTLTGGLNDIAPMLGNILFGTGLIVLVYFIAARLFDPTIGLISAFLVAIDPLGIKYSRSVLAQADSIFFLYLALLLYIISLSKKEKQQLVVLVLSGVVLGFGITVHYNIIWIIPVILFNEIVLLRLFEDSRYFLAPTRLRIPLWLAAWFTILVLVNIPFAIVSIFLQRFDPNFMSYFGELKYNFFTYQATQYGQTGSLIENMFSNVLIYPQLLIMNFGIPGFLVILLGVVLAFRKLRIERHYGTALCLTTFLFSVLLWSLYPVKFERTFVALVPMTLMVAAVGLGELHTLKLIPGKKRAVVIIVLVCIIALFAMRMNALRLHKRYGNLKYGARAMAEILEEEGGRVNEESFNFHTRPIWQFYLQEYVDENNLEHADKSIDFTDTEPPTVIAFDHTCSADSEFFKKYSQYERKPLVIMPPTRLHTAVTVYMVDYK